MKKFPFAIIFWLISCIAGLSASPRQCRVDTLLRILNDGGQSNHVMIIAHRGDWRSTAENSLQAYQRCIDAGIDGIEIDLKMTKDSVLIIMHDETLDRTTTAKGKVSDYTWDELKECNLVSPIRVKTRQTIPTFEDVLLLAKGKCLIQVDKWKPYKEKIIELARKHDCERQIIIRATTASDYNAKHYGHLFDNVIFMPVLVCNGKNDDEKLDDFLQNSSSPCIALSFTKDDFPVLQRSAEISQKGCRLWLNSLWGTFNAGHDDELALTEPEGSYGWLLDFGANVIFSDNPMLLKDYLSKIGRREF
ncbi:MAG: glycerophosphodiester phosphodiesterase family protein [Clostridium sp.]|nr:glycerophosphodiester phosphodiesterase family protein [Clostridium sp.]